MKYSEPPTADREALATALATDDPAVIAETLVGLVHPEPDGAWLVDVCLALFQHDDREVRSAAAVSLGHVARLHRRLDQDRAVPALKALAAREPELAGRVEDALEDIDTFT